MAVIYTAVLVQANKWSRQIHADRLGAIKCGQIDSQESKCQIGRLHNLLLVIKLSLPFRSISLLKAEVNFSS